MTTMTDVIIKYLDEMRKHKLPMKGLILGPKEYLLLRAECQPTGGVDELGNAELTIFQGLPIRLKVTKGIEPEIDPSHLAKYIKFDEGEEETASVSNGAEIRDVGQGTTEIST